LRFVKSLAFALALGLTSVVAGSATPASAGIVDAAEDVARTPSQCLLEIQNLGPAVGTVVCVGIVAGKPATFVFHVSGHVIEFVGELGQVPGSCQEVIQLFGPVQGAVSCVLIGAFTVRDGALSLLE
jgi:hypothetical protein